METVKVRIETGPLKDYEGIVLQSEGYNLLVKLRFLGKDLETHADILSVDFLEFHLEFFLLQNEAQFHNRQKSAENAWWWRRSKVASSAEEDLVAWIERIRLMESLEQARAVKVEAIKLEHNNVTETPIPDQLKLRWEKELDGFFVASTDHEFQEAFAKAQEAARSGNDDRARNEALAEFINAKKRRDACERLAASLAPDIIISA